jgi:hypothetical protein
VWSIFSRRPRKAAAGAFVITIGSVIGMVAFTPETPESRAQAEARAAAAREAVVVRAADREAGVVTFVGDKISSRTDLARGPAASTSATSIHARKSCWMFVPGRVSCRRSELCYASCCAR